MTANNSIDATGCVYLCLFRKRTRHKWIEKQPFNDLLILFIRFSFLKLVEVAIIRTKVNNKVFNFKLFYKEYPTDQADFYRVKTLGSNMYLNLCGFAA